MTFGEQVRQLRQDKGLTLRDLAPQVGVVFTYLSKVENGRLGFGDYPSEELILKIAKALDADADELLVIAKKIPASVRRMILERPDAFLRLARMNDEALDRVLAEFTNSAGDLG